jgi:flagellin-like hook-associated protein FlgL
MSGIVLSSSVRQNLLSLQSTADLLATTQSRLSTGKKVNTALDNPTNFFTAQSLDGRASDINNLLDGIGNGVQVLQAANAGITSLSKLVDTAKSVANQVLQTTVGYSTKSNVSATVAGATALDLRGTTTFTSAIASSNVLFSGAAGGVTPAGSALTLGGLSGALQGSIVLGNETATAAISATTKLNNVGAGAAGTAGVGTATVADGDSFTVNGHTITFKAGAAPVPALAPTGYGIDAGGTGSVATDGAGNSIIYIGVSATASTATVGDVLKAVDLASGVQTAAIASGVATLATAGSQTASSVTVGGNVKLQTSTGGDLSVSGKADFLKALGLTTALGSGVTTVGATRSTSGATLGSLISDGATLNVNGKTITFKNALVPTASATHTGVFGKLETDGAGNSTVYLQTATVADVLAAVDIATGVRAVVLASGGATANVAPGETASSVNSSGVMKLSTGSATDLNITSTGNALSVLGLNGPTGSDTNFTATRTAGTGGINGKTLTFSSFNGGSAVSVTFGDGTGGTVKTLDQLNVQLLANNQTATIDSTGKLTISSTNDYASSTLGSSTAGGVIGGTVTTALAFSTASSPIVDPAAQAVRSNLVKQYNDILAQITTTAQDASFNGINLLLGDQLKLTFNETGKSTLNIVGVTFNAAGLGLANLTSGIDFIDNAATNKVVANLSSASTSLRTQGSALGSNLSIVQIRQDFSKNLINVLQTGSSNLTLADTNEEAANSQALSTRQSIAVSALALANTSQQSVLQLLR